ncbi:MAG: hypothetical protein WCR98_07750 [Saccharofermentanales bacterium]
MTVTAWISIVALVWCFVLFLSYLLTLIRKGKPEDLSQKSGNTAKGILYSNTGAMMPNAKESAYMHLPTYTAGIIFHLGNFLSLLMFVWVIICCCCNLYTPAILAWILAACLTISSICGFSIFVKRAFSKNLRSLSCFDDYFSNGICTLFQIAGLLLMLSQAGPLAAHASVLLNVYFIVAAVLFFWMPLGKIRHLLYYFSARYHLGFFYGWRNTWPPKKA